jgi:hypothetical protein
MGPEKCQLAPATSHQVHRTKSSKLTSSAKCGPHAATPKEIRKNISKAGNKSKFAKSPAADPTPNSTDITPYISNCLGTAPAPAEKETTSDAAQLIAFETEKKPTGQKKA